MNFEEHAAKSEVLAPSGLPLLRRRLCQSAQEAAEAARELGGRVVVKAQVPTGKRGKAGGVKLANSPEEAQRVADAILSLTIGGHKVERLLVEQAVEIEKEYYAAVLNDSASRKPLLLFSAEGGMDIEEIAGAAPGAIRRLSVEIDWNPNSRDLDSLVEGVGPPAVKKQVADALAKLFLAYRKFDAELLEINPLALLKSGDIVALDCKFVLDDSAVHRQPAIAAQGAPENLTMLEKRGLENGLKFIQLEGNVGVLANGAGLTMTTMDVIRYFGGRPANFLEIGGEAYTKGAAALDLVLANPGVKSLVVNFCGAFARTDVMAEGIIKAWRDIQPTTPVFFSIHGTGEKKAIAMVRDQLRLEPYDRMEDAVEAAVRAAQ